MGIVHIVSPALLPAAQFELGPTPPRVGGSSSSQLSGKEAFASPDGAVSTGTWEAGPGRFARAVVDAEFSHFISGRATFETETGQTFEFEAGDAAYFPPLTRGVWTIHETLRKTYCIWR
ncbi:MAG TPA: cupin domain-containing protein [Steroidobacteraceae bacterium]|jgi:hypothetical protein|nr:cupin domain-containing protein [Steroidobacteraceae bacterium]